MTAASWDATPKAGRPRAREWVHLAALLAYTVALFYGVGVPSEGIAQHWYEPRTFFADLPGIADLLDAPGLALLGFSLPSLVLLVLVFRAGTSAVARTAAFTCLVAAPLFVFYGTRAAFVWEFFGWRGSAVLWLLSFSLGLALGAPFLARSWLRLGWPRRVALYLPFFLAALAFIRNATGTDESLRFAISPWPAVPVFGLEIGALFVCVSLAGVAIALFALARFGRAAGGGIAALAGLGGPALLLLLGAHLEMLPFGVGPRTVGVVMVASAVLISATAFTREEPHRVVRRRRARWIGVGAALVALPLLSGQAIARYDYHVTRDVQARAIIDALQAYLTEHEVYPDTLEELVEGGYLEKVPTPAIGFGFLYDGAFRYQSFGTSFILEFPAPRWVECAYTPPWEDEEEEDPEAKTGGETSLGEAWSCPSKPPELW